jgi:hypothetical protein
VVKEKDYDRKWRRGMREGGRVAIVSIKGKTKPSTHQWWGKS